MTDLFWGKRRSVPYTMALFHKEEEPTTDYSTDNNNSNSNTE